MPVANTDLCGTNLGINQSKPQQTGIHSESDGRKLARNKEKRQDKK